MSFDDLHAVLRRRALSLKAEGYDDDFLSVLYRASEELLERKRCTEGSAEQEAVEAVADNRRLRNTLIKVFGGVQQLGLPQAQILPMLKLMAGAIKAVPEPGKGRRILALEIGPNATREFVERRVAELLDQYFTQHVTMGGQASAELTSEDNEDAQPSGAGRDADQHPSAEGQDDAPGEAVAGVRAPSED
jgi:hypothetical protein